MESRRRIFIILASITLHILLLFLWENAIRLKLFDFEAVSKALPKHNSIVFDLQPPDRPREVIETPEDAKVVERQKKANFLSDKNALARNEETNPSLVIDEAFAKGVINSHDLPARQALGSKKEKSPISENELSREGEKVSIKESKEDLNQKEDLVAYKVNEPKGMNHLFHKELWHQHRSIHDNRASRAQDMGGLSFNTYNWDFAPYMLILKEKIRKNIYPPASFYLGMVSGTNQLRFKIYPNGKLKDLEILGYEGDKSLMKTSYNAVDASSYFPRLPQDFPAPYLEVTANFSYIAHRKNN